MKHERFGELELDTRTGDWRGEWVFTPTEARVRLQLFGTQQRPDPRAVGALEWLKASYESLTPQLAAALWVLWESSLEDWPIEAEIPRDAAATWSAMALHVIAVRAPGDLELVYAFAGDVWPDGMFTVAVGAGGVRAISVDD